MQSARAFTLIDMFVTMAALVVLAAVVVPKYGNATDHARESSVLTQLTIIRKQVEIYNAEHPDHRFSPLETNNTGPEATRAGTGFSLVTPESNDRSIGWQQLVAGDYLSVPPRNPLQGNAVKVTANPGVGVGWVFADPVGTGEALIYAVNAAGGYLDTDTDGVPD